MSYLLCLLHHGESTHSGHYRILVKDPAGTWSLLDDETVDHYDSLKQLVSSKSIQPQSYVFAYRRLPLEPDHVDPVPSTSATTRLTLKPPKPPSFPTYEQSSWYREYHVHHWEWASGARSDIDEQCLFGIPDSSRSKQIARKRGLQIPPRENESPPREP